MDLSKNNRRAMIAAHSAREVLRDSQDTGLKAERARNLTLQQRNGFYNGNSPSAVGS
jgi:hypothetical protein